MEVREGGQAAKRARLEEGPAAAAVDEEKSQGPSGEASEGVPELFNPQIFQPEFRARFKKEVRPTCVAAVHVKILTNRGRHRVLGDGSMI
jgi:hypothetical protein